MPELFTYYENLPLSQLADKLDSDFYQPVKEKSEQIVAQLILADNIKILSLIFDLMETKQQSLLSYLQTLAEKSSTGHNCSTCSGKCDMGHAEHLMNIKESHITIGNYWGIMDMNEMPDELQQLLNMMTNLVQVEEQVVVPKIWNAQRKINVAD